MEYRIDMGKLDQLHKIDQKVLQHFIDTGKSVSISKDMQNYILRVNAIPAIVHYEGASVTRVIGALRKQFPGMTYSEARGIYYDAMNLFYMDDDISSDAWDNYYAGKLDDLAQLSIAQGDNDVALKCFTKAHELRIRSTERIKPEAWHAPIIILNNKLKPEDLGYKKKSVYDIARRDEEGFYTKQIEALPISRDSKIKLLKDAAIDVKAEDVEDETD